MVAFLTADKVKASGGQVDENAAAEGMATMGRYGEQCEKQQ